MPLRGTRLIDGLLYGRRKFTIALLALTMTFVLAVCGIVSGGNWVTGVGLIVGLYGGAEMGEEIFKRRS